MLIAHPSYRIYVVFVKVAVVRAINRAIKNKMNKKE